MNNPTEGKKNKKVQEKGEIREGDELGNREKPQKSEIEKVSKVNENIDDETLRERMSISHISSKVLENLEIMKEEEGELIKDMSANHNKEKVNEGIENLKKEMGQDKSKKTKRIMPKEDKGEKTPQIQQMAQKKQVKQETGKDKKPKKDEKPQEKPVSEKEPVEQEIIKAEESKKDKKPASIKIDEKLKDDEGVNQDVELNDEGDASSNEEENIKDKSLNQLPPSEQDKMIEKGRVLLKEDKKVNQDASLNNENIILNDSKEDPVDPQTPCQPTPSMEDYEKKQLIWFKELINKDKSLSKLSSIKPSLNKDTLTEVTTDFISNINDLIDKYESLTNFILSKVARHVDGIKGLEKNIEAIDNYFFSDNFHVKISVTEAKDFNFSMDDEMAKKAEEDTESVVNRKDHINHILSKEDKEQELSEKEKFVQFKRDVQKLDLFKFSPDNKRLIELYNCFSKVKENVDDKLKKKDMDKKKRIKLEESFGIIEENMSGMLKENFDELAKLIKDPKSLMKMYVIDIEALEKTKKEHEDKISSQSEEIESLKKQLEGLKEDKVLMKKELENKVKSVQEDLETEKDKFVKLEKENETLNFNKDCIEQMKLQMDSTEQFLKQIQESIKNKDNEIEKLKNDIKEKQEEIKKLEKEVVDINSMKDDAEEKIKELNARITELGQELDKQVKEKISLSESINIRSLDISKSNNHETEVLQKQKEELNRKEQAILARQEELTHLMQNMKKQEDALNKKKREIASANNDRITEQQERINELRRENRDFKEKLKLMTNNSVKIVNVSDHGPIHFKWSLFTLVLISIFALFLILSSDCSN